MNLPHGPVGNDGDHPRQLVVVHVRSCMADVTSELAGGLFVQQRKRMRVKTDQHQAQPRRLWVFCFSCFGFLFFKEIGVVARQNDSNFFRPCDEIVIAPSTFEPPTSESANGLRGWSKNSQP